MKRFIISICVLVIVTAGVVSMIFYVRDLSERTNDRLEDMIEAVHLENYEKAQILTDEFISYWKQNESFLIFFIRHEHLDQVSSTVSELNAILHSDPGVYLSKCSQIKEAMDHLKRSEFPLPFDSNFRFVF